MKVTTSQTLMIFIRGINGSFHVHEELANLNSFKGTTSEENVFLKRRETLSSSGLVWEKFTHVKNDSSTYMYGSKTDIAGRTCEEIMHMSSDNSMVYHRVIHQERLCRNFSY
jgi:hypothetical protein